jgi:serine/threonine protein kinase
MIMNHMNHPFIVNLYHSFQTSEKIFLVMKFQKGGELFAHLQHARRFDQPRATFYAAQVFLALSFLHSQKYVYRDLKPENVLMDEKGYISLADFGMAKFL